jgi:hypothetical protein
MESSQSTSKSPAFVRPPFDQARMDDLDNKYQFPERLSKFVCYFGKYRGKATFAEVLKDEKYTDWILGTKPMSANIYLYQRYARTLRAVPSFADA